MQLSGDFFLLAFLLLSSCLTPFSGSSSPLESTPKHEIQNHQEGQQDTVRENEGPVLGAKHDASSLHLFFFYFLYSLSEKNCTAMPFSSAFVPVSLSPSFITFGPFALLFPFRHRHNHSHHFEDDVEHGQAGDEDEVGAGEGLVLHREEEDQPPTALAREGWRAGGASRWGRVLEEGEERVRSLEKGKGECPFKDDI